MRDTLTAIGIFLIVIGLLFLQMGQPANAPPASGCKLEWASGVQYWKCPVRQ